MRMISFIKGAIIGGVLIIMILGFCDLVFPITPPLWAQFLLWVFLDIFSGIVLGGLFEQAYIMRENLYRQARPERLQWE